MDGFPPPLAAPVPSRRRTGLLVAGILLLLIPFLFVNPLKIGDDAISTTGIAAWPWERFGADPDAAAALAANAEPRWKPAPLAHVVEVIALFVTGLLAVAAGLGLGGRRLLLVLVALGAFYAIRLHGVDYAYPLAAVETFGLSGFLTTLILFTGCLLLRSASESGRPLGRRAVVVGAALAVVLVIATFATKAPIPDVTIAEEFKGRLPERLDALLGRGPGDADTKRRIVAFEVCGKAIPEILYAVAVAFALLAALRSRGNDPKRGRRAALVALVALSLTWLVPWGAGIGFGVFESVYHRHGTPLQSVVASTGQTVMQAGFGLLLLVAFALARLGGGDRSVPGGASLPLAPSPVVDADGTGFRTLAFGAALVIGGLTLWVGFRPDVGLFAHERAWTILGAGLRWDREVAALLAVIGSVLLATIGLVRARQGVGLGVVTGTLAVAFVLEHALRMLSRSPTTSFFGVTAYVPYALAAVVAGLAGNRARAARASSVVASVLLLMLFAEPGLTYDPETSMAVGGGPYASLWTLGFTESRTIGDYLFGFVPEHGCPAVVAWLTVLAVAGLVSTGGGRTAWWTRALFGVAVLWPLVQAAVVSPPRSRFDSVSFGSPGPMERAAALAVFAFIGLALTWAGAVAGRRGPPSTTP